MLSYFIQAYSNVFMAHLCEPSSDGSDKFMDGIPKENMPRQGLLNRIGVMELINQKVREFRSGLFAFRHNEMFLNNTLVNGLWSIPEDNPGNKKEETTDEPEEKPADDAEQEAKEASEKTAENGEKMEVETEADKEEPKKVKEENGDAKDAPSATPPKKVLAFLDASKFNINRISCSTLPTVALQSFIPFG